MKFLPCHTHEWVTPIGCLSREELVNFPYWCQFGKEALAANRKWSLFISSWTDGEWNELWPNDFTKEKCGEIYLVLGCPKQASRQLQSKWGAARPYLVSYKCIRLQSKTSTVLLKYIFCSVLCFLVLNDPTDGGSFFQIHREARLRFQSRDVISDIWSTFILAFFHLLIHSYTFLDQEPCAAMYCRPPCSILEISVCFLLWTRRRKRGSEHYSSSVLDLGNSYGSLVLASRS